jgi:Na+/H+ antiporter NhaD/arsenite permease-like protein
MQLAQILALVIFVIMFGAIIWGKVHRYIPALVAALLVILVVFLGVMSNPGAVETVFGFSQFTRISFWLPGHAETEIVRGINWQTIVFISGMMIMVEGLGEAGFFRWLCLLLARMVNYRVIPLMIVFMLLSGFLAMFIDSITVILFLASVTVELARLLRFDPAPMIIAEIFASNVGGAATMSGDPPNIIIGTAFGFTFTDFLLNTGVIAWVGMLASLAFFYFSFRRTLTSGHQDSDADTYPGPAEAITNRRLFLAMALIFLLAIVLLVTHAQTGLSVALIGVIAAMLTLAVSGSRAVSLLKRFDWRTILFFIGLFIVVGGLEETGVLEVLAGYIADVSGGNVGLAIALILWVSAFASAIVDNIPLAATMVPVIASLSSSYGFSLETLSWTLALGTDIGGNATPIGASANVVGTAIAEREGHPIGWGKFIRYALPAMLLVVGICHVYLLLRYT